MESTLIDPVRLQAVRFETMPALDVAGSAPRLTAPRGPAGERLAARVNRSGNASTPAALPPRLAGVAMLRRLLIVTGLIAVLCGLQAVAISAAAPAAPATNAAAAGTDAAPPSPRVWRRMDAQPRSTGQIGPISHASPDLEYSETRFMLGDDPAWSRPDFDDSAWTAITLLDPPARAGIYWLRWRVRLAGGRGQLPPGLFTTSACAFELHWDGALIARNGRPANRREDEVAGKLDVVMSLPPGATGPEEHVVAVRISSYRCGFPHPKSAFILHVVDPEKKSLALTRAGIFPTLAAGAMLMVALASLLMWTLAARRAALLWLAGICLASAAMQGLLALRRFYVYPFDWHYPILTTVAALIGLAAFCVVGFVATHFATPYRRILLCVLPTAFALVAWISPARTNSEGACMLLLAFAVALVCALLALRRHRREALVVAAGLAAAIALLVMSPVGYTWQGYFLRFQPALLCLIAALALRLRDERAEARQVALTAARLELELLKKNLQPHFLMNTLTVLTEIVEESPRAAVALIDDLAGEFRLLARLSAEKQIPLAQELDLCRAHLRVMSQRTGQPCELAADNVDGGIAVPPALILTLIENGFSHQRAPTDTTRFTLRTEKPAHGHRLIFFSPGAVTTSPGRPPGGTGLRYIKARLEETAPSAWSFRHGPANGGWETTIELAVPATAPSSA